MHQSAICQQNCLDNIDEKLKEDLIKKIVPILIKKIVPIPSKGRGKIRLR